MGSELQCKAKHLGKAGSGKALLETNEIIFRSEELRFKIQRKKIQSVNAANGNLRVKTAEGETVLVLGAAATKWLDKILHPKSRMEKLGVKAGQSVKLMGPLDKTFKEELSASGGKLLGEGVSENPDWIFFAAEVKKELVSTRAIARQLRGAAGLWIVYPKGKKEITENDVLSAGRAAGLRDVKVVGFSETHTALKFVIPAEKR